MRIVPADGRVVVVVEESTNSFLPEHLTKDALQICEVIRIPEKTSEPVVGSKVLIPRNALREVKVGSEVQHIVFVKDIAAYIIE